MAFATHVAIIFACIAFSCWVAIQWVRIAHYFAKGHTENIAQDKRQKMIVNRMAKAKRELRSEKVAVANNRQCCFSNVADNQHSKPEKVATSKSMFLHPDSGLVSITFHSDSLSVNETDCKNGISLNEKMDWSLYGNNVVDLRAIRHGKRGGK